MAGSRGYRNYRGRTNRGKIALTVFLILVILAAVVVMLLQKHIVYDVTGTPHLELPWQEETKEEPELEEFELTIQAETERKEEKDRLVRGFSVPARLDPEVWSLSVRQAQETLGESCNAVLVTLKDKSGNVYFNSAAALPGTVQFMEDVTDVPLAAATDSGLFYPIARISCFRDSKAANWETEAMGLMNTGGYIFYDGNNNQWLDPGKPVARQYLCAMAAEAAALGFDEILLTDVGYPTEGKLDKVDDGGVERAGAIQTFLEELRATLPGEVRLSIELPMQTVLTGQDEVSGHVLKEIAKRVDAIYAQVTPAECAEVGTILQEVGCAFVPLLVEYDPSVRGSFLLQ